jgi:hypothetical protein
MRLGRLLFLAGAALAANQYLNKTEKGKQLKKDLADNGGKLMSKLNDLVKNKKAAGSDLFADANPASNSSSNSGTP